VILSRKSVYIPQVLKTEWIIMTVSNACLSAVVFYIGATLVIGIALSRESTEHTKLQFLRKADHLSAAARLPDCLQSALDAEQSGQGRMAPSDVLIQDMIRKGIFTQYGDAIGIRMFNIFSNVSQVRQAREHRVCKPTARLALTLAR
jgi:hypothetical protein